MAVKTGKCKNAMQYVHLKGREPNIKHYKIAKNEEKSGWGILNYWQKFVSF